MPGPMGGHHGGPGGPRGPMGGHHGGPGGPRGPMGGHHGGPGGPHGPMGGPPPRHYGGFGGYRRPYYRSGCLGGCLTLILGCGGIIALIVLLVASIF